MLEETKEEYLRRHRQSLGINPPAEPEENGKGDRTYGEKFKKLALMLLLLAAACGIYYVFGMMRAN